MKPQKILFLYLKTGGGHISAAKALSDRIKQQCSDSVETILFNPVKEQGGFMKHLLEDGYRFTSNKLPALWIFFYNISKITLLQTIYNKIMDVASRRNIHNCIKKNRIDKVVILHFLLVQSAYRATLNLKKKPKLLTIITDPFTAHPLWFYNRHIPVIVFSTLAKETGIRRYLFPSHMIHQYPIILREEFTRPFSERTIEAKRKELGCAAGKPVFLIAGGGEGLPKAYAIVREYLRSDIDANLLVVCGKDTHTRDRLRAMCKKHPNKIVKVYGFVDFMFTLMNIADVIVTKGGPATVMEALMLKKPLIITSYLYGQERGNVDFLIKNRIGYYIDKPSSLIDTLRMFIRHPTMFYMLTKRINRLRLHIGTDRISKFIVGL